MNKIIILFLFFPLIANAQNIEDKSNVFEAKVLTASAPQGEEKTVFSKTDPSVTLSKWNGEAALQVKYDGLNANAEKSVDEKIKWKSADQELHAYPIEDGTEIEVLLKAHPATNVFTFTLSNYEDLDFFYQPPLDEEDYSTDKRIKSCTPTECIGQDGKMVRSRPDNVVGSYAVYHKTKRDHHAGGTNYEAGKAYHIFRPQAIDANGEKIWASLDISEGTLSVTVPQDFLNNATYPVIVDPTFGYNTLGGSTDGTGKYANAFPSAAVGSGDANPGTAYYGGDVTSGTATVYVAVYDNGDGNVSGNNRLAVSSAITLTTVAAFRSAAITWTGITNGTTYFIEGYSNTAGVETKYDTGATDQYTNTGVTASPPDPHATREGTAANFKASIYIDYTATATGTPGLFVNGGLIVQGGMVVQ